MPFDICLMSLCFGNLDFPLRYLCACHTFNSSDGPKATLSNVLFEQ